MLSLSESPGGSMGPDATCRHVHQYSEALYSNAEIGRDAVSWRRVVSQSSHAHRTQLNMQHHIADKNPRYERKLQRSGLSVALAPPQVARCNFMLASRNYLLTTDVPRLSMRLRATLMSRSALIDALLCSKESVVGSKRMAPLFLGRGLSTYCMVN